MMMVRCILVETTVPVRIRPRMETRPVKGHFLSVVIFVVSNRVFVVDLSLQSFLIWLFSRCSLSIEPNDHDSRSRPFLSFYRKLAKTSHTDVLALNGGLGGTETQTNILVPPALFPIVSCRSISRYIHPNLMEATHATLARAPGLALGDKRDVRLLLESTLRLDGQLGSHFCGCLIVGREG